MYQVTGGAFRQESMPGGVGILEGHGETGWIVAKDMDEYMETFNKLEISGGKVTGIIHRLFRFKFYESCHQGGPPRRRCRDPRCLTRFSARSGA